MKQIAQKATSAAIGLMGPMDKAARRANVARNLYPGLLRVIMLTYVTSALLLLGFYYAGTIRLWVPLAYVLGGPLECAFAYYLAARAPGPSDVSNFQAIPRLALSTGIQLLFLALVPQVGFYFICGLFVVYSIVTMGISGRQSLIAWCLIVATGALLLVYTRGDWTPHRTLLERALVFTGWMLMLYRTILLGVLGRTMRITLHEQSVRLSESVSALRLRDESLERANAELHHRSTHDALTGLGNRALFASRLEETIAGKKPFAVCVLDLDRFKLINDSLGHGAGDALLKLVAQRLQSTTRADDVVVRAGGDEFLLLLRDVEARADIERLASRWMDALTAAYRISGIELHVSPSIGIACSPLDGTDGEHLLARADEAMYHAKQSGRNVYRFYDSHLMGFSRERLAFESELHQAVANKELRLYYQPKVDVSTGKVRSLEALLRWQHPARGVVMPGEFITIAEEIGLILPIGAWVIREACRQARAWQQQGLPYMRIAVNVSPIQFRQNELVSVVREALADNSLDPSYLELELTESALMHNTENSLAMLEQLSRLGVVVAIDDFGTGYSSMTHLKRFPIDILKIDCSFIRHLETDQDDASIVRAIISLAHGLRLKVVAEGVESAGQLDILRTLGCDQYQGFLRSPAVPPREIEALMAEDRGRATIDLPIERTFSKLARLLRVRSL
jgi:diguanylate cyclase (GGDEF)-like protein